MSAVDPRLLSALSVQFSDWRAALEAGARRVGWKLGAGDRERIGPGPVIGHLTTATQLEPGAHFRSDAATLHADAELAVRLARDVDPDSDPMSARAAIAGFGAALELVDLASPPDDPHSIVATNVFHRAFALGPLDGALPAGDQEGTLIVNGEVRASANASLDVAGTVCVVATLLDAMEERLRAGDCLITGAVVQVPVSPGDEVTADFGALGEVKLAVV